MNESIIVKRTNKKFVMNNGPFCQCSKSSGCGKARYCYCFKNNTPCTEKCNCSAHCCKNKVIKNDKKLSQPRINFRSIDDLIERTSVNEAMRLDESVCTHHSFAATETTPQNFIQGQVDSHCAQPTSLSWGNLNKDINELKAQCNGICRSVYDLASVVTSQFSILQDVASGNIF